MVRRDGRRTGRHGPASLGAYRRRQLKAAARVHHGCTLRGACVIGRGRQEGLENLLPGRGRSRTMFYIQPFGIGQKGRPLGIVIGHVVE